MISHPCLFSENLHSATLRKESKLCMIVFETMFFTSFTSASCFIASNLQLIIVFIFKMQRFYSCLVFMYTLLQQVSASHGHPRDAKIVALSLKFSCV
jgi:type IV secretory pathway TrbL component